MRLFNVFQASVPLVIGFKKTKHCLYLTLRGVSVSKRFSRKNNESKSLFSHFMTKSFKVPQNVKITILINISNKYLVQNWDRQT